MHMVIYTYVKYAQPALQTCMQICMILKHNACLSGAIILLKIFYLKTIGFRIMPLVQQMNLVMLSKYCMFGVDTF